MRAHEMAGTGGIRSIRERWIIEGALRLETAASIGGGAGDLTDLLILRDHNGFPFIPGTSLAGALRSHLADLLGGYRSKEDPAVGLLFGGAKQRRREEEEGDQSALIVFNARTGEQGNSEIRDGVKIDARRGTAEENKKFDIELLPPGTVFLLRFDLLIEQKHDASGLLDLLAAALSGLSDGSIRIGGRRSRGLGQVTAERWRGRRFDLTTKKGWCRWLATQPDARLADDADDWPRAGESTGDARERFMVDLSLQFQGPVLIAAPSEGAGGPDVMHIKSGDRSVLPGTSLTGALRNRALRIARAVRPGDAEARVDLLFGPSFAGNKRSEVKPKASRLRVSETRIDDQRLQSTRIAIDRFTQAPLDGALLEEEASYGGRAETVRLEIRSPQAGEPGLLLLVVKDLLDRDLPLGGTSSVGRGVVEGTALIHFEGSAASLRRRSWRIPPEPNDLADTVADLNALVTELRDAPVEQSTTREVAHASR